MVKLYYGGGVCTVEGNISSLDISYKGNILIESKLPHGYTISLNNNKLSIKPFLNKVTLNELFEYIGEFKIRSAIGYNEFERQPITIVSVLDYSELLNTNAEDMTTKSEDLKATYLHVTTLKKTRISKKVYENLDTSTAEINLSLNGSIYEGFFHLHVDGTAMTGRTHTKESMMWEYR